MAKRARPREHTRRTRYKRVLINKGIKKKVTIKTNERKIFKHISNPSQHKIEYGGGIDFNKRGSLENIQLIPGTGYGVNLPTDYEAIYHTHPDNNVSPPSPEDVLALLDDDRQQAEIIFRGGKSFTIIKTPSTRKLQRLSKKEQKRIIEKIFTKTRGKSWEKDYKQELEKLGFFVQINKKTWTPIKLPIRPRGPDNSPEVNSRWDS